MCSGLYGGGPPLLACRYPRRCCVSRADHIRWWGRYAPWALTAEALLLACSARWDRAVLAAGGRSEERARPTAFLVGFVFGSVFVVFRGQRCA